MEYFVNINYVREIVQITDPVIMELVCATWVMEVNFVKSKCVRMNAILTENALTKDVFAIKNGKEMNAKPDR